MSSTLSLSWRDLEHQNHVTMTTRMSIARPEAVVWMPGGFFMTHHWDARQGGGPRRLAVVARHEA